MRALKAISISLFFVLSATANAQTTFEDMVLVYDGANVAFYMDIFEAPWLDNAGQAQRKPARWVDGSDAVRYCQQQGKRIPTQAEWMLAASNLGQNKNYTLIGDLPPSSSGQRANIAGVESLPPKDIQRLGIDAIGTVGMSGNRAEWVQSPGGLIECGSRYDLAAGTIQLSRICANPADTKGSTVRCVVDYADNITLTYSTAVNAELRSHLKNLGANISAPATPAVPNKPVAPTPNVPPEAGNTTPGDKPGKKPAPTPLPEPSYDNQFRA